MLAGIREILIITTPEDQASFRKLPGDGSQWGLFLNYEVQPSPDGLAQAFLNGENSIDGQPVALILGDNIFYSHGLPEQLLKAARNTPRAGVFAYHVNDPERYGVVHFDSSGRAQGIEEKPKSPRSNYAVTGLYFYGSRVVDFAKSLSPASRGELEITDLNRLYLDRGELNVEVIGRGTAWLDTGTHESLLQAAQFIEIIERRQGLKICCPEEIAYKSGFINGDQLRGLAKSLETSGYGHYLYAVLASTIF